MDLFSSYHQFVLRTGMLISRDALDPLNISPCDSLGGFRRTRRAELQAICLQNRSLQIVSWLTIDRCALDARLFSLATGDQNPRVIFHAAADDPDLEVLILRANQTTT